MEKQTQGQQPVKQTKKQLFWEIFRFLLVGGTATVVDYIVYYLFRQWILPPTLINTAVWNSWSLILSTAFGFGVGLVVNCSYNSKCFSVGITAIGDDFFS